VGEEADVDVLDPLDPLSAGAAAAAIDSPPPSTATATSPPMASRRGDRREPGRWACGAEVSGVGVSGVMLTGDDHLSSRIWRIAGISRDLTSSLRSGAEGDLKTHRYFQRFLRLTGDPWPA
jgi:hypothetical protein